MKAINIIAGSSGLSVVLRSDTPSGKGRVVGKQTPVTSKVAQPDSAEASAEAHSAEGSAVASGLEALPAAPSDFNFYEGQAGARAHMMTDYLSLLRSGMVVEGRFAQPCAFRYKDRQHVQAIAVQPTTHAVWQRMELLDQWELDGITPVEAWVDLSKESQAAARKGTLQWCNRKHKLQNKNCRYQRSADLYAQFFRDVRRASVAFSAETLKEHPILFVDVSCWTGESIVALLEDVVVQEQSDSLEDGADAKPPIYGLFFDKKDVHYQVSRLRRDLRAKRHFMDQTLPLKGEQAKPCPKLLALREKSENLELKALGVRDHSGKPCLVIPSEIDLPFMVKPDLKRRLAELRGAYSVSGVKRQRTIAADVKEMPTHIGLQALLTQFHILGRGTLRIESKEIEVLQVGVLSAGGSGDGQSSSSVDASAGGSGDGATMPRALYFFYLANPSDRKQITLMPQTLLTKGTPGIFYNQLSPDHEDIVADLLEKGTALWQWTLTPHSLFEFRFDGNARMGGLSAMYKKACESSTTSRLTIYAHNVSDVAIQGKAVARAPRVHPRKQSKILVALQPHSAAFSVEKFGHLFLKEHIVPAGEVARLVWPVDLHEPGSHAVSFPHDDPQCDPQCDAHFGSLSCPFAPQLDPQCDPRFDA